MSAPRWDDLTLRLGSAVALIGIGLAAVAAGGLWFQLLVAAICGLMVWELVCMLGAGPSGAARGLAALTAICVLGAVMLPPWMGLPLIFLPAFAGLGRLARGRVTYVAFTALTILAGLGLIGLRDDFGLVWMLWLVLVVVATDVLGYFAGRRFGGPKLWPRVSPSKTWSGTVAGWIGAALVGLVFARLTQAGAGLAGVSIALSMASQIGDIAESAIKRRAGVKDSSSLIPGHGGLMDRFDGMLGAAVFLVVVGTLMPFPPGLD